MSTKQPISVVRQETKHQCIELLPQQLTTLRKSAFHRSTCATTCTHLFKQKIIKQDDTDGLRLMLKISQQQGPSEPHVNVSKNGRSVSDSSLKKKRLALSNAEQTHTESASIS